MKSLSSCASQFISVVSICIGFWQWNFSAQRGRSFESKLGFIWIHFPNSFFFHRAFKSKWEPKWNKLMRSVPVGHFCSLKYCNVRGGTFGRDFVLNQMTWEEIWLKADRRSPRLGPLLDQLWLTVIDGPQLAVGTRLVIYPRSYLRPRPMYLWRRDLLATGTVFSF